MNFGSYNPVNAMPVTSVATINVSCTALTAGTQLGYDIILGTGNSGSYTARQMSNGTSVLNYNIFVDVTHINVWGDKTSGTQDVADSYIVVQAQSPTVKNYTAYGLIPGSQNVSGGSYVDNIILSVTF